MTTLTQTQPQLHEYIITLVSKELKADVQVFRNSYFSPSLTRQFLETDLSDWLDDYTLIDWHKIDPLIQPRRSYLNLS